MSVAVGTPLLDAAGVTKRYGHVEALRGADLTVDQGEIHALLGDNGAGKSTLVKVLAGVVRPDGGELRIAGSPVSFQSPRDAQAAGIETVYQDLALAGTLNAAESVFLGREPKRGGVLGKLGVLDRPAMRRRTETELQELGIKLPSLERGRVTVRRPASGGRDPRARSCGAARS